ncbi:MAG TPA: PilX N-terminal domain-containing pilus assembly protein [Pseudomonadales bacterium]
MAAASASRQRGVLTLVVALSILVLSTLVTFSVAKAILMEQKISNNEQRAKQAFEAAEAGMLAAMDYINNDPDANDDAAIDPVFDTNGDGVGDTNTATIGTGSVVITTADLSGGDMTSVEITALGYSDDRSARRTITQTLVTINPLPNAPQNPVVTRGSIIIGGSATVHNPEGHSTIWSGGDVDLGSNNSTKTEVPDVSDPTYPGCMDVPMTCDLAASSSRNLASVDVIENDSSLGALSQNDFFRNFFGVDPATYKASMVTVDTTPADFNTDADRATYEVIWVEGDTVIQGTTIGCTTNVTGNNVCPTANQRPSIVIINGNASFTGTPHVYGILFVSGNLSMSGNATVHGAVVAAGTATSSTGGSLDVWFNGDILADVSKAGNSTGSAGTWKDF